MLTTEQIREWVAALRSGLYKQGRGRLKRGRGYCCLGVANEVCDLGVPPGAGTLNTWLFDPVLDDEVEKALVALNDNYGADFDDIAELLEELYLED